MGTMGNKVHYVVTINHVSPLEGSENEVAVQDLSGYRRANNMGTRGLEETEKKNSLDKLFQLLKANSTTKKRGIARVLDAIPEEIVKEYSRIARDSGKDGEENFIHYDADEEKEDVGVPPESLLNVVKFE